MSARDAKEADVNANIRVDSLKRGTLIRVGRAAWYFVVEVSPDRRMFTFFRWFDHSKVVNGIQEGLKRFDRPTVVRSFVDSNGWKIEVL